MSFTNETVFQETANRYLDMKGIRKEHDEKGGYHKNKTHRKGKPDLSIFPGGGKVFFVELKMPGKKLSPDQEKYKAWCIKDDYHFHTCHTWEDFIIAMEKEGIECG